MERQPQNPELRNNPENFHLCIQKISSMVWVQVQDQNTFLKSRPDFTFRAQGLKHFRSNMGHATLI